MIANTGGTPVESGEDGLNRAIHRERTRYHERQAALLARVLGGKPGSDRRSDPRASDLPIGPESCRSGPVWKIAPGTAIR